MPAAWRGRRVEAVIDPGFGTDGPGFVAEGMVYDAEGVPVKGLHPLNRHVPVASPAAGGEQVGLLLEAAANPAVLVDWRPTPLGDVLTAGSDPLYRFDTAELAVLDEEVWHLVLDVEVLEGLMHELDFGDPRRHEILRALEEAGREGDSVAIALRPFQILTLRLTPAPRQASQTATAVRSSA